MSTIVVDLNALRHLRARCAALRDAFGSGDRTVRSTIEAIGPARVTSELGHFESHWQDGHDKVRKHLDGMLQRLDGAIKQYAVCEQHLVANLKDKP